MIDVHPASVPFYHELLFPHPWELLDSSRYNRTYPIHNATSPCPLGRTTPSLLGLITLL